MHVSSPESVSWLELESLGERYLEERKVREALHLYEKALEAGADPHRSLLRRWESWMLLGEFERAWVESDRLKTHAALNDEDPWNCVLIRCCRGLGDAIQFLRYVPLLKQRSKSVLVQAQPRLLSLLPFIHGIDEAFSIEQPMPKREIDQVIECSELPYVFRTTLSTIPDEVPYIHLPTQRSLRENCERPRVGLVWSAGAWNPYRSIPFEKIARLFEEREISWISLQRGPAQSQVASILANAVFQEPVGGIVETAYTITNLDLVISVDTMVAHLTGALGVPVWVLLKYDADWRWMLGREGSPWYPSMRLFRQHRYGDWDSVIDDVITAISSTCFPQLISDKDPIDRSILLH